MKPLLVASTLHYSSSKWERFSWQLVQHNADGNSIICLWSVHMSKCLRIADWFYIDSDGSWPLQMDVMNARANSPQSLPPSCFCTLTNSTVSDSPLNVLGQPPTSLRLHFEHEQVTQGLRLALFFCSSLFTVLVTSTSVSWKLLYTIVVDTW